MMEPAGGGQSMARAFLRVGGKTLARHQLDVAHALQCERAVFLTHAFGPEVVALQHEAERYGMAVHVASGVTDLSRLVSAADELVVLQEGLLLQAGHAIALLEKAHCITVQPADSGVTSGFERLDLNWASGGAMRLPGRLIEGLTALPSDCDIPSALARVAIQAGVPMREVPAEVLGRGRWRLVRSEIEAYAIEGDWLADQLDGNRGFSPGKAIARFGVLTFGASFLHTGRASEMFGAASLALVGLAVVTGWLGSTLLGYLICAIAWIVLQTHVLLQRVETLPASRDVKFQEPFDPMGWAIDLALVVLCAFEGAATGWKAIESGLFPALMLILLLRQISLLTGEAMATTLRDRLLLIVALAIFTLLGVLHAAVTLLAIGLAIGALVISAGKSG